MNGDEPSMENVSGNGNAVESEPSPANGSTAAVEPSFPSHPAPAAAVSEAPMAEDAAPAEVRRHEPQPGWLTSLQSLAVTVVIAVFVITFILQAFQIPSESMEDTLLIGDYLLVDKVHYGQGGIWGHLLPYSDIRRGDIVVFRYPVRPAQHFVKRVIGLPGDHVKLVDRRVFVNGQPLRENYVVYRSSIHDYYRDDFPSMNYVSANVESHWWLQMRRLVQNGELVVPRDSYFVLGDNRDESLDSRYWGFVPRENVIGTPLVIYWSLRSSGPEPEATDGKLARLAYIISHLYQDTRWNRTFRLIR